MKFKFVELNELFIVKSGDFHATKELDKGVIPLVSCGDTNNGVIGFFDIEEDKIYNNCLTVAYNGLPLQTKYHPYRFGAKDDVGILIPRRKILESTLLYVAALLNHEKWRYSYSRKCFKNKLPNIKIYLPMFNGSIDEAYVKKLFSAHLKSYIPEHGKSKIEVGNIHWGVFQISDLFYLEHGDFNSYGDFDKGDKMIVSRTSENNGVVGHYTPPDDAREFPVGTITVSTITGDTFVQLHEFYASDKVVLLSPRNPLRPTTLFFIAFSLNHQNWRYSYGRSCFKRTLKLASINLPINNLGEIDEEGIENIVRMSPYWNVLLKRFL